MKTFCLIALMAVTAGAAARAQSSTITAPQPLRATDIYADSMVFDGNGHTVTYHRNVRVIAPDMKLTCALLVADLPPSGGHVSRIVAETNVVIDFLDGKGQTNHATSDKAIYDYNMQGTLTNETVTLTGHASVTNAQGSWIKGEPITWDRVNNRVSAPNEQMSIKQNTSSVMGSTNSPAPKTNKPVAPKLF
jgi:lipopolysaccharide export system protein LptA